jgi:transposase-like protein
MKIDRKTQLAKSPLVKQIPMACSDENAAVEFFEQQRWGDNPACVHCGSVNVYKMLDAKTGGRNKRFLWRCHECKEQYTVRIGTVYEESRLPLRHWCYAFWRAATSKKGVAALEIMRHCQISYKSALFLMHRIRWAMAPMNATQPPLSGIVECDETFVGGKPRKRSAASLRLGGRPRANKQGHGTDKTPVLAMVQRGGNIRVRRITKVTGSNLTRHLKMNIDPSARIMTDEWRGYSRIGEHFAGGHETVKHSAGEYARGDVTTNTVEGFFSILKRGLHGVYHAVSFAHLPRYLAEFEFRYNARKLNDGDRTALVIQAAEGKRLTYFEASFQAKERGICNRPPKDS